MRVSASVLPALRADRPGGLHGRVRAHTHTNTLHTRARRHALHAQSLELRHPRTDEPLVIRAPLPEDMARAALVAGLQVPPELLS